VREAGDVGPAVALPYAFDTNDSGRVIAKATAGIEIVVAVLGAIKLTVNFSALSVLLVLFVLAAVAAPGLFVFRKLGGASGTITAAEVTVAPAVFLGLRTDAPEGSFRLDGFSAVRVEEATATSTYPHDYQRVYLAGKAGTPDILVARTEAAQGRRLGIALATLLRLPVEEKRTAY
jgi:hypothetical protein